MNSEHNPLDRQTQFKNFLWRKAINIRLQSNLRKNKSKEYYVVKCVPKTGFFSNYFYTIGHMMLATKMGYKVAVDWENYKTPYNEEYPINDTLNCWEYFFEQPNDVKVVYENCSSPYVSEDKYPYKAVPYYGTSNIGKEGVPKKKQIKKINEFIAQYCPIKEAVKKDFDAIAEEMSLSECLGVHIRGTDMKSTDGHNKPAALEKVLGEVEQILENSDLNKVFLCTDEEGVKELMKEKFGDKVQCVEAYRSQGGQEGIHLESKNVERENHHYLLGLEVLRDAYLLSRCQCLVCGKSNVAYAAIVMNNNQYNKIHYTN